MKELEQEVIDEVMEGYWVMVRDIWKEINEEYGYIPFEYVIKNALFQRKWLERVRVN